MTFHTESGNLIVALDPKVDLEATDFFSETKRLEDALITDLENLNGLGVLVKLNTYIRLLGLVRVVELLMKYQLFLFADWKLFDIFDTVEKDVLLLKLSKVTRILTLAAGLKPDVYIRASELLPDCAIAPVGPLTDLQDPDFQFWHWTPETGSNITRDEAVTNFFRRITKLDIPHNNMEPICGPKDISKAPTRFDTITPSIKTSRQLTDRNSVNAASPAWAVHSAMRRGRNTRLVIGRGVTGVSIPPREAALEIMDEMAHARATFTE